MKSGKAKNQLSTGIRIATIGFVVTVFGIAFVSPWIGCMLRISKISVQSLRISPWFGIAGAVAGFVLILVGLLLHKPIEG